MTSLRRVHARVWPEIGTKRSGLLLAALAAAVYTVEALAWPVQRGRDAWDYLVYYASFLDGSTPFPLVMLVRSPVTAFVLGVPMQIGGARALEIVAGVLYAVTIVAWAATALTFSRGAALATSVVLLVYAPFAVPFHEPSSDMVVATGFALFALGLARTWRRPTAGRFAALGAGVAVLTLARPSYEVLLLAAVIPAALPGTWRGRTLRTGAFVAAAVVPLVGWAVVNGVRYGDTTVSRSGILNVPFYPAFLAREIEPDNGPASRRLAELVRTQVLTLPAYRRLGVETGTYFDSGENFEVVRLAGLVDRVDGLSSDYGLLRDAAREEHVPGDVVFRGVNLTRSAGYLGDWLRGLPQFEFRTKPDRWPLPRPTIEVGSKRFPNPAAQPPSPDAVPYGFLQCASDEIQQCILRHPGTVFADTALARRYTAVTAMVRRFDEGLGARRPNTGLSSWLDRLRGALPPVWTWIVAGAIALVLRRPSDSMLIVALTALSFAVLVVHALGGRPDPLYALPVLPALPVAAICALAGARRQHRAVT